MDHLSTVWKDFYLLILMNIIEHFNKEHLLILLVRYNYTSFVLVTTFRYSLTQFWFKPSLGL